MQTNPNPHQQQHCYPVPVVQYHIPQENSHSLVGIVFSSLSVLVFIVGSFCLGVLISQPKQSKPENQVSKQDLLRSHRESLGNEIETLNKQNKSRFRALRQSVITSEAETKSKIENIKDLVQTQTQSISENQSMLKQAINSVEQNRSAIQSIKRKIEQ